MLQLGLDRLQLWILFIFPTQKWNIYCLTYLNLFIVHNPNTFPPTTTPKLLHNFTEATTRLAQFRLPKEFGPAPIDFLYTTVYGGSSPHNSFQAHNLHRSVLLPHRPIGRQWHCKFKAQIMGHLQQTDPLGLVVRKSHLVQRSVEYERMRDFWHMDNALLNCIYSYLRYAHLRNRSQMTFTLCLVEKKGA